MQSKILSNKTLLYVSAGLIFLLALFFYFNNKVFVQNNSSSLNASSFPIEQEKAIAGLPVRLKIPIINVDTRVEYVGLTSQGAMDVLKDPADVAWFNLGSRPGDIGSAVISGHYGWKNNIPAVFDDLSKLQKGNKLHIEDEKGIITTFVVRESRTYGENDYVSDVFSSNDGKAHLNLITCEGVWNKALKSYSKRLVVFTDKE